VPHRHRAAARAHCRRARRRTSTPTKMSCFPFHPCHQTPTATAATAMHALAAALRDVRERVRHRHPATATLRLQSAARPSGMRAALREPGPLVSRAMALEIATQGHYLSPRERTFSSQQRASCCVALGRALLRTGIASTCRRAVVAARPAALRLRRHAWNRMRKMLLLRRGWRRSPRACNGSS